MAIIVSNGPTSLAAAGGFYRVEAANFGLVSATVLALSSARTIPVTFANAGNCQGVILVLTSPTTVAPSAYKSVVVTLQENVASVWTDRATVTFSAATICNDAATVYSYGWVVPFTGGTFPYAVDTASNKWRFSISQSGAEANNWNLKTSDGTNPFFAAWCDNAVTFADNDTVIAKDVVTIDKTATVRGTLGTGDTTMAIAMLACRSTTPTPANVAQFVWSNPPAASYTLTVDGAILLSAHSGFRIGTDAAPIPFAERAIIKFKNAATFGSLGSFFATARGNSTGTGGQNAKQSFFAYGEYPAVEHTTLAANAAAGQAVVVTTVATGWQIGDKVAVGGVDAQGLGDATKRTIANISGTSITLSSNLGAQRLAGGRIINLSRYGVSIDRDTASNGQVNFFIGVSSFVMRGVEYAGSGMNINGNMSFSIGDALANMGPCSITHSAFTHYGSGSLLPITATLNEQAITIDESNFGHVGLASILRVNSTGHIDVTITNCRIVLGAESAGHVQLPQGVLCRPVISGNVFENTNNQFVVLSGFNVTFTNNVFYGSASALAAVIYKNISGTLNVSGNSFDRNLCAIQFDGYTVSLLTQNDAYGAAFANTVDVSLSATNPLVLAQIHSPNGALVVDTALLLDAVPGSHIRLSENDDIPGDDSGYLPKGRYQRTGSGLSDSTVRTAGGYALRLQPTHATDPITWPNLVSERTIPTGNIQNKTMTVSCWIFINNAAYYAGSHTKPTLKVKYDDATIASAVASATAGSWQQLAVTFTPVTQFGEIEVWIEGATDAAGANAYVYVDDVNVAYPAGVQVSLGSLDLWSRATPIWPPIATFPALGGVWDEPKASHAIAGSFGELLDAAISSRLAAASYTAPDNAGIANLLAGVTSLVASAGTLTAGERSAIATALLDLAGAVDGLTVREWMRLQNAAQAGDVEPLGNDVLIKKFGDPSRTRIEATTTAQGRREIVAVDVTD